jgi:Recombination endonuclease VII
MKTCSKCKSPKELAGFSSSNGKIQSWCRTCVLAHNRKKYSEMSQEERRGRHYKWTYGFTKEQIATILNNQGNKCAICGTSETYQWQVDHDHETRKIRAVLCQRCNYVLGAVKEDVWVASGILSYIIYHKQLVDVSDLSWAGVPAGGYKCPPNSQVGLGKK